MERMTTTSDGGLEVLDRDECMSLLESQRIGRVGLSIDSLPVVLPVNYVVDRWQIVFRTGHGSKLGAALQKAVVCFEVDDIDHATHTGWSVVVTGTARRLSGFDAASAEALPLEPWSPTAGDQFVAISMELVSGRRIRRGAPEAF